ncbi:MAG: glycosyltransferase, partial [Betaproteobacteria bacterium]
VARSVHTRLKTDRPIEIIRPAISNSFFERKPPGGVNTSPLVGFVGHHHPEKGLDLALNAAAIAVQSGVPLVFKGIMSGSQSSEGGIKAAEAMARAAGISHLCEFTTGIERMEEFLAEIDVLMVPFRGTRGPSDYPIVLLEAMAMGVLVLATPVGAIPEVVGNGDNGFLAEDISAESIAVELIKAISLTEDQTSDIRGRARGSAMMFSAGEIARQTEVLLKKIVNE